MTTTTKNLFHQLPVGPGWISATACDVDVLGLSGPDAIFRHPVARWPFFAFQGLSGRLAGEVHVDRQAGWTVRLRPPGHAGVIRRVFAQVLSVVLVASPLLGLTALVWWGPGGVIWRAVCVGTAAILLIDVGLLTLGARFALVRLRAQAADDECLRRFARVGCWTVGDLASVGRRPGALLWALGKVTALSSDAVVAVAADSDRLANVYASRGFTRDAERPRVMVARVGRLRVDVHSRIGGTGIR